MIHGEIVFNGERGSVLLIVLWGLTLISAVAMVFGIAVQERQGLAVSGQDLARAEALADAGVYLAVYELLLGERDDISMAVSRQLEELDERAVYAISISADSEKLNFVDADENELRLTLAANEILRQQGPELFESLLAIAGRRRAQHSEISGKADAGQSGRNQEYLSLVSLASRYPVAAAEILGTLSTGSEILTYIEFNEHLDRSAEERIPREQGLYQVIVQAQVEGATFARHALVRIDLRGRGRFVFLYWGRLVSGNPME